MLSLGTGKEGDVKEGAGETGSKKAFRRGRRGLQRYPKGVCCPLPFG